jgi:membrane protein implicated in regulation of membrane protease activity
VSGHGWHYTPCGRGGGLAAAAVIGAAFLIGSGALAGAVAVLTSFLEILLACTLAALVIAAAGVVLIWRKYGRRSAPLPEQITEFHAARELRARQQRQAIAAPAQHLHIHLNGDGAVPDEVLRAINGAVPQPRRPQS